LPLSPFSRACPRSTSDDSTRYRDAHELKSWNETNNVTSLHHEHRKFDRHNHNHNVIRYVVILTVSMIAIRMQCVGRQCSDFFVQPIRRLRSYMEAKV
jgi:hypothetical protein